MLGRTVISYNLLNGATNNKCGLVWVLFFLGVWVLFFRRLRFDYFLKIIESNFFVGQACFGISRSLYNCDLVFMVFIKITKKVV